MYSRPEDGGLTVRFWGTRGSLPRPGPDTLRYGGNTPCLEVRLGSRLFLLDAGSGIEPAGRVLAEDLSQPFDILLSHLHHDHISGIPFFIPALKSGSIIRFHCGNLGGASAEAALNQMFAPPLFPITLDQLPSRIEHIGFQAGSTLTFDDGIRIETCLLTHPGGATAYRFEHEGRVICYVSDVEHTPGMHDPALIRLCRDADYVIYDTMYTDVEFQKCKGWVHSTLGAGVALCRMAGAKALIGTHHHIRHSDAVLDGIDAELRSMLPGSFLAREGQVVTLRSAVPARTRMRLRERVG